MGDHNSLLGSLLNFGNENNDNIQNKKTQPKFYVKDDKGNFIETGLPEGAGSWLGDAKLGLEALEVGTGLFNAYSQYKNNKFLQKYYKNQMKLQRADFANNARSTNEALQSREAVRVSAHDGLNPYVGAGKQKVADYMQKWGVSETI